MKGITQQFYGTTEEWENNPNPLYNGVFGVEVRSDGSRITKIGDGETLWPLLPTIGQDNIAQLQAELDAEVQTRAAADEQFRTDLDAETQDREAADTQLQNNIATEALVRGSADTTLQGNIDGKIAKAAAGEPGTLMQSITIKEDTTSSVIVRGWSRNVTTPGDAIPTDVALPMASEEQAGIMPAESFSQIEENTIRIDALEDRALHYSVALASDSPTQEDLQEAYEDVSGESGEAPDQVTLDDTAYNKSYTWYETSGEWVDRGPSTIAKFTNSSPGTIKGSNTPGKVFAENDGSGSVVGWDATQTAISNLDSGKADKTVATKSANGLMSATDKTKLDEIVDIFFPVGSTFEQKPWDLSPEERNWPGTWVNWSLRAWEYCLSATAPTAAFIADWKSKRHDIWTLNTNGTVATLGTKKYTMPTDYVRVLRQVIHNGVWDDTDMEEGDQIEGGEYDGWYVWQVLAPAGTFSSVEDTGYTGGGHRPPFISGGVQADRIREISGVVSNTLSTPGTAQSASDSALYWGSTFNMAMDQVSQTALVHINFKASRNVPVGPDNAPANLSVRIWRRVPVI